MEAINDRRAREFYKRLEGMQRQVIDALLDKADGRTQRQLLEATGLQKGVQLAAMMAALIKNAKKVAADPTDVYTKAKLAIGEEGYDYRLTDSLRQALQTVRNGHAVG